MTDKLEWIPKADTLGRVAQMPDMVAAYASGVTVDPDMTGRTRHAVDERCEADLDRIDILTGRPLPPLLGQLACGVSQPLWKATDHADRQDYPVAIDGPRWDAECQWIVRHWTGTIDLLDDDQWHDLCSTVNQVWSRLCRPIGLHPPIRAASCPKCGGRLIATGPMLVCTQVPEHEYPGPERLESMWRRHGPMTSAECCAEFPGLTPQRIWKWHQRRKLKAGAHVGRSLLWYPWDIIGLLWPDIVEAIDTRDREEAALAVEQTRMTVLS